jgi:nicotinate-nucleotide adenylyltransferase
MSILKYGIMGGSFNPIHNAHIHMAEDVMSALCLDRIVFIPTGVPPHKKLEDIEACHRLEMTKLATAGNDKFEVFDIEILNQGTSFTVDTVGKLKLLYPDIEFYFITGADSILDIPKWKDPHKLMSLCKFVCVKRPNYSDDLEIKIQEIINKFGGEIIIVEGSMLDISSTEIRISVKKNKSIEDLVHEAVNRYIKENNLYVI